MFEPSIAHDSAAPAVGPFSSQAFLQTIWSHTADQGDRTELIEDAAGSVAVWHRPERLEFVGPENLVDYRSPLGRPVDGLAAALKDHTGAYRFDSLPDEAADVVAEALDAAGLPTERVLHEAAAVLALPETFDDYLAGIGKKERHETRRKIRRFIAERGEPRIVTYESPGPALHRFVGLHRLSDGAKSTFMTAEMVRYFEDLVALDGWRVDALYGDGPRALAAAVSYADDVGYYLYNSAFDPTARDASPGVVLLSSLIQDSIDHGRRLFDFLKGSEAYKYRLGAEARPLFAFEGVA